ncbi:hypothetical protein [Paraburkholderia youngii]|uniref:hypothetical protein n=1 Tax=Paraburkholderia youngii TaxID=2782701 RepID=UPI003D1FA960
MVHVESKARLENHPASCCCQNLDPTYYVFGAQAALQPSGVQALGEPKRRIYRPRHRKTSSPLAAIERQIARLKTQADAMTKKQDGAVRKILKQMKAAGVTVEDIVAASGNRNAPTQGNAPL